MFCRKPGQAAVAEVEPFEFAGLARQPKDALDVGALRLGANGPKLQTDQARARLVAGAQPQAVGGKERVGKQRVRVGCEISVPSLIADNPAVGDKEFHRTAPDRPLVHRSRTRARITADLQGTRFKLPDMSLEIVDVPAGGRRGVNRQQRLAGPLPYAVGCLADGGLQLAPPFSRSLDARQGDWTQPERDPDRDGVGRSRIETAHRCGGHPETLRPQAVGARRPGNEESERSVRVHQESLKVAAVVVDQRDERPGDRNSRRRVDDDTVDDLRTTLLDEEGARGNQDQRDKGRFRTPSAFSRSKVKHRATWSRFATGGFCTEPRERW